MDFGLIALALVIGAKILDYIAPKTKTKLDDGIRDVVYKVLPLLPAAKEARPSGPAPEANKATPEAPKSLAGFKVRDHR